MATGFTFTQSDNRLADIDDILIRREYFSDGTLWNWGGNTQGGLGNGFDGGNYNSPATTVGGGTNWKTVATGENFFAGIKSDGTLWTCGYGGYGRLGDNTTVNKSSPVTTIAGGTNWKQVACGGIGTSAIKTDGSLWSWGAGTVIGNNTNSNYSSPVMLSYGDNNWKYVAAGYYHHFAIKTDGTLWGWGTSGNGCLGNNTVNTYSSPVTTSGGITNWKQVACNYKQTAAVTTDGKLYTWGQNNLGQLGDGTTVNKSSPVTTVNGGTNWKQVSCGTFFMGAIKTDGTLWTWGTGSVGRLGTGNTSDYSSPVTTAGGGTNWKLVASGNATGHGIKTDGTLWEWGNGTNLGDNVGTTTSSPVIVYGSGTNWKQVASTRTVVSAITDLSI